jgi:hypothetical protein
MHRHLPEFSAWTTSSSGTERFLAALQFFPFGRALALFSVPRQFDWGFADEA